MAQQGITFEWILEETRAEVWHGLTGATGGRRHAGAEHIVERILLRGVGLLLAALMLAGAAGLSPTELARREAQSGIAFHLNLENQAWELRDYPFMTSLWDDTVSDEWLRRWRDDWRQGAEGNANYHARLVHVQPAGDALFRATVLVEHQALQWSQSSPYQEFRYYRRDGQTWLRTVPPADYWGARSFIETENLRFNFYASDAAMVHAAAPHLEQAYVELYAVLGQAIPAAEGGKVVVNVLPRPAGRWSAGADQLNVASPAVLSVPVGAEEAGVFADDVMSWFTYRALRDATAVSSGRYMNRWPIVIWGLRGWLREDLLPFHDPWRVEAMQVLRESDRLPFDLASVAQLQGSARPTREEVIMRYLAAESFVAFSMERYGRESLRDLLPAMMHFGNWSRIIREVYGVEEAQFIAEWNEFVLGEYSAAAEW